MNVYVRELVVVAGPGRCAVDVYVRRWRRRPARRRRRRARASGSCTSPPGPLDLAKEELPDVVDEFTAGVLERTCAPTATSTRIHANYWLSGVAGHRAQARARPAAGVDVPHARPGQGRDRRRRAASAGSTPRPRSSAAPTPSSPRAPPRPTQLDRALRRRPGPHRDRAARRRPRLLLARRPARRPRRRSGLGDRPGAAVRRPHPAAQGPRRRRRARWPQLDATRRRAARRRRAERARRRRPSWRGCTRWSTSSASTTGCASSTPQPHHLLSTYYRAADVVLVPSRSESFGLVALEAAACGTPVVAAAVGGLRTLVDHGRTGFLVDGRDPARFAAARRRDPRRPARWPRRMAARRRRRAPRLHVVDHRRPPAPALRRPHRRASLRRRAVDGRRAPPTPDAELDALEARHRRVARRRSSPRTRSSPPSTAASPSERRWYVRLRGEEKDIFTVWLTLGQRTLHYETYLMPAPEENARRVLRAPAAPQPRALRHARSPSAPRTPSSSPASSRSRAVDEAELDRILGSIYAYVEQCFRPAMRIGFASRFKG